MKKFVAFLLLFALALVFIGCGEDGGSSDVLPTKITLDASAEVEVGQNINLIPKFEPSNVTNKAVEWKSENDEIASVDANGRVTAKAEGTVKITVTSKADSKISFTISVTVKPVELADLVGLTVNGANEALEGKGAQYRAVPEPSNASSEVTWSLTADEGVNVDSIASINEDGFLTVKATGEVTVVATSKVNAEISASKKVKCTSSADIVPIIDIVFTQPDGYDVPVGGTQYIGRSLVGKPTESGGVRQPSNTELHWTSSNEEIATVSTGGTVTAIAEGTVTITVVSDDPGVDGNHVTKSIEIRIYTPKAPTSWAVSASLAPEKLERGILIGATVNVKIEVGADDEDASATYTSSDENVATVDENGKVTGKAEGTATITATSKVNPEFTGSFVVKVIAEEPIVITKISVVGEDEMYAGYSQQLSWTVFPLAAVQSVTFKSSDESVATVDETGFVTAIAPGTTRIKVTSTANTKVSENFRIKVEKEPEDPEIPNMGGYKIIIMNAQSALTDNDPFLEGYSGSDKLFKQQAWSKVEEDFNCDIVVKAYPEEAPWGTPRINWIKDKASTNQSECDLGIVSSNWIHQFAKSNSAVDVTSFYNEMGKKQMDPALKQAGTFHNKLYVASTGITTTAVNVSLGLFYNFGLLQKLGLDDPATLFNEGKWNYTGFEKWVREAQAALGDTKKALGGHPYYYYYGMTNAAGVKIADVVLTETNIMSAASKGAMELMAKLTQDGCVSTANTWGESKTPEGNDFFDEGVLMITGDLWFVRNTGRWHPDNGLSWEGEPQFGYVPFPYPDDVAKENTRVGTSGLSVYLYVAGRNYPAGVTTKDVYYAMNTMFLNTHKLQESSETFNPRELIYNSLTSRIDNPASIEAIMYYDSSRTFFDPAHGIYGSTAGTRLRQPSIDVMFGGKDFIETFGAVSAGYDEDFLDVYG